MSNPTWKLALLVICIPVLSFGWTYDQIDFPGDVQGWVLSLDSTQYSGPDGNTEWFRYTCTAGSDDTSYNFKMVTGNNWDQDYGGNTTFPKNECDVMSYQPAGDTAAQLAGGATNGYRYVFTAKNPGLNDTQISVMELSDDPVSISSVSGGTGIYQTDEAATITVTLSTNPCPEENVFVRYTSDDWSSFIIRQATISSNVASVTITNLTMDTVYEWYAFSSTASSNYLASTNDFSIDALTLSWDNNSGENYEFGTPGSAAWIYHNNNRVIYDSSNSQFWVKMGYCNGDGTDRVITNAAIYYTTDGSTPTGSYGSASGSIKVESMSFDHTEPDSSTRGSAMWWVGSATNLPQYTLIKYRIGAWYSPSYTEQFADYNTSATNNAVFSFQIGYVGVPELTVDGKSADYTTTKFFIDEIATETQTVTVVFKPGVSDLDKVEIFSNLDRRDYCDVDYTNALISADGYADGIRPPDGNYLTTNDTGAYFTAFPMVDRGSGEYVWTGTISRCGAYRLTARYTTNNMAANTWHWYSSDGRRDHAIVVSPRKVHELTMYELNTLTVEATYDNEAGRSTFVDLLGAAQGDSDGFDPFNLDYLNYIQANCLWFQPIHPNAQERKDLFTPGSPYATRDYFAVSKYYGSGTTEDSAMEEFTNFVAECDAYTGSVGSINIMLDGVFNHTSWDAEFGEPGVTLGFCTNADDRIGWFRPSWYSLWTDYGLPATYYNTAYSNDIATAPDRGDFGKWPDVAEFYYGKYSALVRNNPADNGDYLNEDDVYDFAGMIETNEMDLWKYMAYYTEFWLEKTGHAGTNSWVKEQDERGIDGLRCDFGQGLPPQCWEYLINRTRSMKWNFVFMAETLDGGKPGFRSNRHFDVLNENLVFQFTQNHIDDSWDVKQALEDRRSAYSGGTILLNLTSHDEVLPDDDAWLVASRYGTLSSVDGIPMLFYGQEQGIQNYNTVPTNWYYDGFRMDHEENFGKFVPHFKQWNQLTVWSNPPPNVVGLDQWYGRVNWARHNSAALRSPNRYFLSKTGGGEEARIMAVAKYENEYGSPSTSDVVLAFGLLLRHSESPHVGTNATYDLQGAWDLMGMDTGKYYNVRNLASSDAGAYQWSSNKHGSELYNDGIWVNLPADNGGTTPITNDGVIVQYLKVDEFDPANTAPVISLPGPHILPVGAATNFAVSMTDADSDPVTTNMTVSPAGATYVAGIFSWTAGSADCNTTNLVTFVADDQQGATNSVVTNTTTITVPYDSDSDDMSDGWEWDNFTTLTNEATGDVDGDAADNNNEFIADTDPNNTGSVFVVNSIVADGVAGRTITVSTRPAKQYIINYTDTDLPLVAVWYGFGNTNDGIGTWIETNEVSATYTFTDDATVDTTTNEPIDGRRFYKVKVKNP